jgi:RNA polymerase sigma-70 factor (ECF subfamily)
VRVTAAGDDRAARFERLYTTMFPELAGYVGRRCSTDADDVLAQVFTVAWRRLDHIPPPPQDRLWFFGVARRILADAERSARRRRRLGARLAAETLIASQPVPGADPAAGRVIAAMANLRPADREALRLVLWDGLSHADAAALLGCTANAFEIRYRRARVAVRDELIRGANQSARDFGVPSPASLRGDA